MSTKCTRPKVLIWAPSEKKSCVRPCLLFFWINYPFSGNIFRIEYHRIFKLTRSSCGLRRVWAQEARAAPESIAILRKKKIVPDCFICKILIYNDFSLWTVTSSIGHLINTTSSTTHFLSRYILVDWFVSWIGTFHRHVLSVKLGCSSLPSY